MAEHMLMKIYWRKKCACITCNNGNPDKRNRRQVKRSERQAWKREVLRG